MKIACLSYRGLSHQGIEDAVHHIFPNADVFSIFPQHLRHFTLRSYDILILPGINDEASIYPTLLPPEKIAVLKDVIEQDGLVLWTFCASSYYMFEEISYQQRNGIFKNRKGAGLIKGYATHGFRHLTRQRIPADPKNDYVLASIRFNDQEDILRSLNINGPSLHPAPEEAGLTETFISYADIQGAAGVIKKMGKGMILALGIHPELTTLHPLLSPDFSKHESDRWRILRNIKARLLAHFAEVEPELRAQRNEVGIG